MANTAPTVLLSSTYYDLAQVRADLSTFFIEQMGYKLLAFEDATFPVDTDTDTIDNCRRRVERETDILVLIVGNRYGYVDPETNRSVTNMEYIAARTKGIPIYVFIDKQTITHYELWHNNRQNTFSGAVDNPELFKFIEIIRKEHKAWTFSFERAQDIIKSLRSQFAFLMQSLLEMKGQLQPPLGPMIRHLNGKAFQIALQRPRHWEHRLLCQVLDDELQKLAEKRLAYELRFFVGHGARVDSKNLAWPLDHLARLQGLSKQFCRLVNEQLPIAFGPPGVSGDVERLIFAARAIAKVYDDAMEWTQEVRRAHFHPFMAEVKSALEKFAADFVRKIELIATELRAAMANADEKLSRGETITLKLKIALVLEGIDDFSNALDVASVRFARAPGE